MQKSTARPENNPLVELSSRSELVELAGYGEEKLSSVVVTGTVVCEACLDKEIGVYAYPVSSAMVAVSCKNGRGKMKKNNCVHEKTNEYGDFMIDLPSHLHAIPSLHKACVVKVFGLPKDSPCKKLPIGAKRIKLLSNRNNIRTYTVGGIRLQQTSKLSRSCLKVQNGGHDAAW
ncbi:Pollen ole e 1 allergen and extensin family protein [Thalictrum thalictroides]|uniref:Pollen ole e 1 allergen and extensin family protein n=1 Tax=Thalictrum thalictroides TaxID=46969 RepID=A0A7J6VDY4_THATH|nr:Pollen ole e 1 allergen and extensin family protein [Thalictrum thalictroides]